MSRSIVRVIDRAGTEAMAYHCAAHQVDDVCYYAAQEWPGCAIVSQGEDDDDSA